MKKIISILLVLTTLFSVFAVSASATRTEEYLSDVALIYEDSVEDAREEIAGTDWKLFEQDLNPNADYMIDDGVYLIYKTSTNVEDAITDLRVMDMYGGFSISNYERQLEESRAGYVEMAKDIRMLAAEFKALYEAGDEMAEIAYRQMNYYKDVRTDGGDETDMRMGDFFLNMPDDPQVVQVFFEGNTVILYNLITLLAIGISGEDEVSLSEKIAEKYEIRDTLTDLEYYDDAEVLADALCAIRPNLVRYDTLSEHFDMTDENVSEEEANFVSEYAALALLLQGVQIGETNLADMIRDGAYEIADLYPIVAAMSEGQKLLVELGQLDTVLKYNAPTKPISVLKEMLDETEKEMKDEEGNIRPINVYLGVDRSIFQGNFALTNAAERQQALTGETWDLGSAALDSMGFYIAAGVMTVVDLALVGTAIGINVKISALAKTAASLAKAFESSTDYEVIANLIDAVPKAKNYSEVFAAKYAPVAKKLFYVSAAVALIVVGLVGISTWYNYYNPDYTEIPDTMVDVRQTDLGDKYVKYNAAKVFGEENMNADFNAYDGREWVALYYTKDAHAGNCLLAKFVHSDSNATVARRHQGIAMFGEDEAYNLNSHVYSKNAPGVYVSVRYSTAKKAAENVPSVIGSMFMTGALYTLTALGGAGVGVGATILTMKMKKKKEETSTVGAEEAE